MLLLNPRSLLYLGGMPVSGMQQFSPNGTHTDPSVLEAVCFALARAAAFFLGFKLQLQLTVLSGL